MIRWSVTKNTVKEIQKQYRGTPFGKGRGSGQPLVPQTNTSAVLVQASQYHSITASQGNVAALVLTTIGVDVACIGRLTKQCAQLKWTNSKHYDSREYAKMQMSKVKGYSAWY